MTGSSELVIVYIAVIAALLLAAYMIYDIIKTNTKVDPDYLYSVRLWEERRKGTLKNGKKDKI